MSKPLPTSATPPLSQEIRWLLDEKYGGEKTKAASKDITRLQRGEHLDYVIGWVDFAGCRIDLSQKPLIPRPETEFWTEEVIEELGILGESRLRSVRHRPRPARTALRRLSPRSSPSPPLRILDIFAGSGCIGIAILKHVPWVKVDFAEKEKKFLKQIEISAKLNGIEKKRYRLIQSDIFSGLGKSRLYDYILANPPYIAEKRKALVQDSVTRSEPAGALFGGEDGLYFMKRFLKEAKHYLHARGTIYAEFDAWQKKALEKLLKEFGYHHGEMHRDQYGKWRYCRLRSCARPGLAQT